MFADNRLSCKHGENVDSIMSDSNSNLARVHEWLSANKLLLNVAKTKGMLIRGKNLNCDNALTEPDICINGMFVKFQQF